MPRSTPQYHPKLTPLSRSDNPITEETLNIITPHLTFLFNSPPLIPRILHIAIFIGYVGFFLKLFKPSESNLLFDGSSLILYSIGVVVYLTNIVQGLRTVAANDWEALDRLANHGVESLGIKEDWSGVEGLETLAGKEDNLKVLAASNTILALMLVGVLVLQAGQWYAEKSEAKQLKEWKAKEEAAKLTGKDGKDGKKKQ